MAPRRFVLSAAEMSEGFAAARCYPARADFFAGLPAAGGSLPGALSGTGGELDPDARLMFETIACPEISLRLLNFAEGSGIGIETRLVGDGEETYVALARPDSGHWDLALLGGRDLALALVDALLGVSDNPAPGKDFSLALSMPELAIVLAIAQCVRLDELRARLGCEEGGSGFPAAAIPMAAIEAVIAAEKERPDPGSPLSRLAMTCGGRLFEVLEDDGLRHGLKALIGNGLAEAGGALTDEGLALMSLFKSRDMITLMQTAQRQGGDAVVDSLLFLHGPGSLLAGAWRTNPAGGEEGLVLSAMQGAELLDLIDARLGPLLLNDGQRAPGIGFCLGCGTLYEESPRYCRECGAAL
ncbi:MAG: hypothetical protein PHE36_12810 [Novosphingobium sp.]|nr:hypothetical protein [Novosphingobium sp.]